MQIYFELKVKREEKKDNKKNVYNFQFTTTFMGIKPVACSPMDRPQF